MAQKVGAVQTHPMPVQNFKGAAGPCNTALSSESSGSTSHNNPEQTERRRHTRYAFTATAEVIELQSKARIAGRGADLSLGGCYVDTISPFPKGTLVKLRLTEANRCFESKAVVVYAPAGMGMGLAFLEVQPDQLEILKKWVRELSGELTSSSAMVETTSAGQKPQNNEHHVLIQLVSMLIQKRILTDTEGATLLQKLLR